MKRFTLSSLRPGLQEQVVAALHPAKPSPARKNATLRPPTHPVYPFTLWLDYRVPSLNTVLGGGIWTKTKHDRLAANALHAALAICPSYPRQGSGRLHVIVTCYVCQPRDADNPTTKFLNDQLRKCGLLRNDDPSCMALTVNPEVKVNKRKLEGTKLTLVECLP